MDATHNYFYIDNMIAWMNEHHSDKFHFRYSTPGDYVDAVAKHNVTWPTKSDDMFPYSDGPDAYWTGYYSSRPNRKEYIRRGSHNLHASAQLYSEKLLDQTVDKQSESDILESFWGMMDVMGVLQHHDAVSGTAKEAVANDYDHRLFVAMEKNNEQYIEMVEDKIKKIGAGESKDGWTQCFRTNSTYLDCPVSNYESNYTMNVAVHNPSTIDLQEAKLAVPHGHYKVEVFNTTS